MNLHLVDINSELVNCWKREFSGCKNVHIKCCDILKVAKNTIVSPANSYGFMDGGIDRLYTDYFGLQPQTEIQKTIERREDGYLPVGEAVFVNTGNDRIPYMISAPTMITPGVIPPSNSFFAMSAVLLEARRNRKVVTDVYCPGLGTLTGRLSPEVAAGEMALAYKKFVARYA